MSGQSGESGPISVGARLPALDIYKKWISSLFSEGPEVVSRKLDRILRELRAHRLKVSGRTDADRHNYAKPVYEVSNEARDDLFETMETLVDRHPVDLVRIKTIQIFLEFGAIEAAAQGETPFGLHALASLGNIMRSSRGLEKLFVSQCLKEPFAPIVEGMSVDYLGLIAKEVAHWTEVSNFKSEFADGFIDCAKKLAKAHQVLLPRVQSWWDQGTENAADWAEHTDNNAFNYISQLIAFTCISPTTAARYLPELPIVLYTKMDIFNRIRPSFIRSGWVFPPFKLIAALAQVSPEAAEFFAGPSWDKKTVGAEAYEYYQQLRPALQHQRMMKLLLGRLSVLLWEERENIGEPVVLAHHVSALFAIMSHSGKAVDECLEDYRMQRSKIVSAQSSSAASTAGFGLQLLRRALEFAQSSGDLCHACLRGVLLLVSPSGGCYEKLAELRDGLEQNMADLARSLQETAHQLLTTTADQQSPATKLSLVSVIEVMDAYHVSENKQLASFFSQEFVKNYTRDHIIFNVLDAEGAARGAGDSAGGAARFIDDDVRLAAAKCLASMDVGAFSQQGIQSLLDIFSAIPTVISATRYQVLCTLMYFLFQLALHDADDTQAGTGAGAVNPENFPGKVFRSLYASEFSNCIFTLLERLVVDGSAETASYWEVCLMQACVKFLMTGWVKVEFRAEHLGQRPIEILTDISVTEQQRLAALNTQFDEKKQRYYSLIEQRRCVVSEDDLTAEDAPNLAQPGAYRLPPIRKPQYAGVQLSRVDYQHTYIEQTTLGGRVASLYPIVPKLKRVDTIAFRIIHQIANVMAGLSFASTVDTLRQADFATWNASEPGRPVSACDAAEQERFTVGAGKDKQVFGVSPLSWGSKEQMGKLSKLYDAYIKASKTSDHMKSEDLVKLPDILAQYRDDDRAVSLVVFQGRELVAAALARPYDRFKEHFPGDVVFKALSDVDMAAEERRAAELASLPHCGNAVIEHYWFNPELKGGSSEVHRALLGATSHALYTCGFAKCFFIADKLTRPVLTKSGASLCNVDDFKGDEGGRLHAYFWYASTNIWTHSADHEFVVENKMLETLLQLFLDDQTRAKMEGIKRADKLPSQKALIKRFRARIRLQMELYGGRLTSELEGGDTSASSDATTAGNVVADDGDAADGTNRRVQPLAEREFKYTLANTVSAPTSANSPVWEKIVSGSKEESLVEVMSRVSAAAATVPQPLIAAALYSQLPPDLNPRTNPDPWLPAWLTQELEGAAREVRDPTGADGKGYQRDVELELRRRRRELLEQEIARQRDDEEADKRRKEWLLPPLLQSWSVPCSAAALRMIYTLLTQSQRSAQQVVLRNLSTVPADGLGMLEALRSVLSTFHYQLRGSVLDAPPAADYHIALKTLDVICASLGQQAVGLDAALASLEYVELCLQVLQDICRLLLHLLQSRNIACTAAANQGAATPAGRRKADAGDSPAESPTAAAAAGADSAALPVSAPMQPGLVTPITANEERVMASVCSTLSALLSQVERVCLFRGSSALISRGNQQCRRHAQQLLFTQSPLLRDTVVAILLYDLERENETDDGVLDKDRRYRGHASVRDLARIHAIGLLAHFIHVDPAFKRSFFSEFCVSSIKAERSLRASLVQEVLVQASLLDFKQQLEPYLRARGGLGSEEHVLIARFMEHTEVEAGVEHSGTRLLVVTTHAYLVSEQSFPVDAERSLLSDGPAAMLPNCVFLSRREFADIIRIFRDMPAQALAIRSYSAPAATRLASATASKRTDVFMHRGQGVAESVLAALSTAARDDAHRIHTVASDEFTPLALRVLLEAVEADGDDGAKLGANAAIRLMTHVRVLRRDGSLVPRVLMWVADQANQANATIILAPYAPTAWLAATPGESAEAIVPAGGWEPGRFPRLGKASAKAQELTTAHSASVNGLFAVSSASLLPDVLRGLPSLPVGSLSAGGPLRVPVSELQSVDFTEDADTDMIMRIRRTETARIPSVYVRFEDDTGREMWRRELKKLFFGGSMGQWNENLLPDLSNNSRRKQQLL